MGVDERARHELHRKLEEVLGADEAATLMSHLPPVGWADVATKHDLAQLEERVNMRFDMVDKRFVSLEERLDLRFQSMEDRFEAKLLDRITDMSATYTRTTVVSVVGSLLTMTGLIFAARLV